MGGWVKGFLLLRFVSSLSTCIDSYSSATAFLLLYPPAHIEPTVAHLNRLLSTHPPTHPPRGQLGHGDPFEEMAHGTLKGNETEVVVACLGDFMGDYCRELREEGKEDFLSHPPTHPPTHLC